MKPEFSPLSDADYSCLQIEVLVEEAWINQFLGKQELVIPVSEKYSLSNLRCVLEEGKLTLQGNLIEKEGSTITVICLPKWDAEQQRIHLEELEIKTNSKNILVKSAGWFATTFMGAKIDKKIEEATNQLYVTQMHKLIEEGITIPFSHGSNASVKVRSVTINEILFLDHSIKGIALVDGNWHLHLKGEG